MLNWNVELYQKMLIKRVIILLNKKFIYIYTGVDFFKFPTLKSWFLYAIKNAIQK